MSYKFSFLYKVAAIMLVMVLMVPILAACDDDDDDDNGNGDESKTFTWRFASHYPPESFVGQQEKVFMDEVAANGGGRIKFEHFPSGSLFAGVEIWNALNDGRIEAGHSHPIFFSGTLPILEFTGFQMQFADVPHTKRAVEGDWGKEFEKIVEDNTKIKVLGWGSMGHTPWCGVGNVIMVPSESNGKKVATVGRPFALFFESQGAVGTQMPSSEYAMAFERNTIDATITTLTRMAYSLVDAIDWVVDVPWIVNPTDFIMVSQGAFDELPADLQQVVTAAASTAQRWGFDNVEAQKQAEFAILEEAGVDVYQLTPAQLQEWLDVNTEVVLPDVFANYPEGEADRLWELAQQYK